MQQIQLHQPQSDQATVLIVGCEADLAQELSSRVLSLKHRAFLWENREETPEFLLRESWHVCLCGPKTTPEQASLIEDFRQPHTNLLWLSSETDSRDPLSPGELLPHDLSDSELGILLKSFIEKSLLAENISDLQSRLENALFRNFVCRSAAMSDIRSQLFDAKNNDKPMLLISEAGIADREVAWTVHQASARAASPFLSIDCESYSSEAFENELFQLGSSPVEQDEQISLLEQLDGGSLHLKNAHTLSQSSQKKLLRFLESPAVPRMNSHSLRYINLRWSFSIPPQMWTRGNLPLIEYLRARSDVFSIQLPSLRQRKEDIPELVRNSLSENAARLGILPTPLSNDAWAMLEQFDWPGNDEQLERVTTQILKLTTNEKTISAEMIEPWLQNETAEEIEGEMTLAEMERQLIEATFARCGGNREKTAQSLGIGLRTLSGKLRQYGYPPRGGPGSNRKRPPVTDSTSIDRAA